MDKRATPNWDLKRNCYREHLFCDSTVHLWEKRCNYFWYYGIRNKRCINCWKSWCFGVWGFGVYTNHASDLLHSYREHLFCDSTVHMWEKRCNYLWCYGIRNKRCINCWRYSPNNSMNREPSSRPFTAPQIRNQKHLAIDNKAPLTLFLAWSSLGSSCRWASRKQRVSVSSCG